MDAQNPQGLGERRESSLWRVFMHALDSAKTGALPLVDRFGWKTNLVIDYWNLTQSPNRKVKRSSSYFDRQLAEYKRQVKKSIRQHVASGKTAEDWRPEKRLMDFLGERGRPLKDPKYYRWISGLIKKGMDRKAVCTQIHEMHKTGATNHRDPTHAHSVCS